VKTHITFAEAHQRLGDFDMLVVLGGGTGPVLAAGPGAEPMPLVAAFVEHQRANPGRPRTLMSVCTGALFLAKVGVLAGLAATTHPFYFDQFKELCAGKTDIRETTRFVVNKPAESLGGMRVITAGGVTAGIDAALYVVGSQHSEASMKSIAEIMQWTQTHGDVM
jgi:transcriptional regulator GlxA family with amidase domain